jgi:hypothetical protein
MMTTILVQFASEDGDRSNMIWRTPKIGRDVVDEIHETLDQHIHDYELMEFLDVSQICSSFLLRIVNTHSDSLMHPWQGICMKDPPPRFDYIATATLNSQGHTYDEKRKITVKEVDKDTII